MHPPVTLELELENGEPSQKVDVPTLKLANYPAAHDAHAAGDEFRFIEIVVGRPRMWAITLKPESYDRLVAEVYKANTSFFGYSARRMMHRGVGSIVADAVRGKSG